MKFIQEHKYFLRIIVKLPNNFRNCVVEFRFNIENGTRNQLEIKQNVLRYDTETVFGQEKNNGEDL